MKYLAGALVGLCTVALMVASYNAGTMRYECVSPANYPMGDGSGRWFYFCAGPEPLESQKVAGLAAARARLSAPTQEFPTNGSGYYAPAQTSTVDQLLRPQQPTSLVSPARPVR